MRRIVFILIVISFAVGIRANAQSYKVIVNSANEVTSLSTKDASAFFLKKKKKWSNGVKVAAVDQKTSSAVRNSFTSKVHGKSLNAIKSYWQQYVFAGKGTPLVEKSNDAEVIEYVKGNPGAIGYVTSAANVSGVTVIVVN